MTYSTSIGDDLIPLVLDTSVLINLYASKSGSAILCALPNQIIVPKIVAAELEHETSKKNGEHDFLQELVATHNVRLAVLDHRECALFERLVSGIPSLDDGEAATIAIAAARNYHPVIDERKGRNRAQAHIPNKQPGWSLDLFRHPEVTTKLGGAPSIDALFYALRDGRMRIDESHCDHVVSLIGTHRAVLCKSLPGYKVRRQTWQESKDLKIT